MSLSESSRGCRACHQRRIRCDRTLPSCKKCEKKGIECPQYGPQFRWTNAVAVRGYSKGLNVPYIPPSRPSKKRRIEGQDESSPLASSSTTSPSSTILPSPTSESSIADEQTLAFYVSTVAPSTAWLDSDENEYKRSIVPLAKKQPVLMMAIRAVCMGLMGANPALSDDASKTAIIMITQMITPIASLAEGPELSDRVELDADRFKALLASMLILSNHSLVSSNLSEARSHREAARILVRVLQATRPKRDPLISFLQNQLASYEVLACTTLTDSDHINGAILPEQHEEDSIFNNFLHTLHRVTVLSLHTPAPNFGQDNSTIRELKSRFDLALGSTLLAASPIITGQTKAVRQDFIRLAHLYHHAGLIYMCERLSLRREQDPWLSNAQRVFDIFDEFEDIDAHLHNLAWPLLIAGIAADGHPGWQRKVSELFKVVVNSTGYEHYLKVLSFLEELWAKDNHDWLVLARAREEIGESVVAV